jgi:hypothetical protein
MLYLLTKKYSFLIEIIKTVIVTKNHIQGLSCNDFYNKTPKLLQQIRSSRKYETSAQKEEPTTSTSDGN